MTVFQCLLLAVLAPLTQSCLAKQMARAHAKGKTHYDLILHALIWDLASWFFLVAAAVQAYRGVF